MPVAVPTNNQPVLFVADPIDIPQPENSRGIVSIFVAVMGLVALGGYGVYKLKMGGGGQSKSTEKEKNDESRCLNLKKLMEEKLRELTDVRGQMESKLKEKAREEIREALAGTPAAKALALVERAEKEYARLEQLYNTCMIEFQTKKRLFLVHGWDGAPEDAWFPWLKRELEGGGFHVEAPAMPNPEWPKIEAWVSHLARVVGEVDEHTFFVGHSIGCQAIMRYIESLPKDKKVGGVVFVAGFFTLMNLENDEAKEIARPWLETPIDFEKVRRHTQKFFALFSDDDGDVPVGNKELFAERLGADTLMEHAKGHFSKGDGVTEIPVVLEQILKFAE
ncbi:MAG: hypothetical protein A3C84_04285 [Candidatus Ryanbacteria bacterium RIFCSPHIGHO2_02_FULL_48_12]|nr:MAG: hypothetical protein A3C84_04285 [Candidatus Ryanbacteria bacterium RIFCSPHIGHO2_02_FULL_48_12]